MSFSTLLLILLAGVNTCIGNILLKKSRMVALPDAGFIEKMFSPWFLAGLVFYGINVVLFAKALDGAPVSVAYPLLALTGFCLIIFSAAFIFGEKLGMAQYLGVALALLSIFLLSRPA